MSPSFLLFLFTAHATTQIYTLSLHDALPISQRKGSTVSHSDGVRIAGGVVFLLSGGGATTRQEKHHRSEEHTSELQSRFDLVCRLLLEKKKNRNTHNGDTTFPYVP